MRPFSPARVSACLRRFSTASTLRRQSAMSEAIVPAAPNASTIRPQNFKREKRPQLTHFLCIPLVNSTSLPQLETSLASFKSTIPSCPVKAQNVQVENNEQTTNRGPTYPLIPDSALRPVGTLHLTLGVMSLPTKERLDEAIRFFHSLNLTAIMREAEKMAASGTKNLLQQTSAHIQSQPESTTSDGEKPEPDLELPQPQPLTISLESLHAFPRARNATVLHAAPVDQTARLYPFCVLLREKFLEIGLVLEESRDERKDQTGLDQQRKQQQQPEQQTVQKDYSKHGGGCIGNQNLGPAEAGFIAQHQSLLQELPVELSEQLAPGSAATATRRQKPSVVKGKKRRPKPLVLHCTVANTIYVNGRGHGNTSSVGGTRRRAYNNNNNKRWNRYSFDARPILSFYRDYYVDKEATRPRSSNITLDARRELDMHCEEDDTENPIRGPRGSRRSSNTSDLASSSEDDDTGETSAVNASFPTVSPSAEVHRKKRRIADDQAATCTTKNPFVWARDFPLEKLCICDMGARKLSPEDNGGLGARLGEEYRAVVERSLLFETSSSS